MNDKKQYCPYCGSPLGAREADGRAAVFASTMMKANWEAAPGSTTTADVAGGEPEAPQRDHGCRRGVSSLDREISHLELRVPGGEVGHGAEIVEGVVAYADDVESLLHVIERSFSCERSRC